MLGSVTSGSLTKKVSGIDALPNSPNWKHSSATHVFPGLCLIRTVAVAERSCCCAMFTALAVFLGV